MQIKHAPSSMLQNPTSQCTPVSPHGSESPHLGYCRLLLRAESKPSAPALTHKRQVSTLVVGVIINEFHKVLVNICMQVIYPWK